MEERREAGRGDITDTNSDLPSGRLRKVTKSSQTSPFIQVYPPSRMPWRGFLCIKTTSCTAPDLFVKVWNIDDPAKVRNSDGLDQHKMTDIRNG